jgi:hypothetical protein
MTAKRKPNANDPVVPDMIYPLESEFRAAQLKKWRKQASIFYRLFFLVVFSVQTFLVVNNIIEVHAQEPEMRFDGVVFFSILNYVIIPWMALLVFLLLGVLGASLNRISSR